MFTIEVEKREKNEKFSFKDLEMFHQECYSGKIKFTGGNEINGELKGYLNCLRCSISLYVTAPSILVIIQTAVDGKERKIAGQERVIQKT